MIWCNHYSIGLAPPPIIRPYKLLVIWPTLCGDLAHLALTGPTPHLSSGPPSPQLLDLIKANNESGLPLHLMDEMQVGAQHHTVWFVWGRGGLWGLGVKGTSTSVGVVCG